MTYDLVIQGGLAVLPSGPARCDIGISGGKIAAIEDKLPPGNRTIDATGKIIVPGGIDSHCHIEEPSSGIVRNAETFASATGSAAAGGTTTVSPSPPRRKAERSSTISEIIRRRLETHISTTAFI